MHSVIPVVPTANAVMPSILGQAPLRMPIGGKIRAGIKVLSAAAARHPRAKEIYDSGVQAGKSFEAIEGEIAQAVPELKNGGLKPQNVAYFSVRAADFTTPEIAALILEKYGEVGEGAVKRLYRFPVIFAGNTWEAVMPHALTCYGASQLKYWSAYTPDGAQRFCMQYAPVAVDATSKRAKRPYGGREVMPRSENAGRCEPQCCREYQLRQCNLSGRFVFLIPGVPSLSAIELPTTSFYAMNHARQVLAMVAGLRGGSIAGKLGEQTFWFSKKLREVSMLDPEKGTPLRVKQWLIELEAPVDVSEVLGASADTARRLLAAQRGVAALSVPSQPAEPTLLPQVPEAAAAHAACEAQDADWFETEDPGVAPAPQAQIKELRQQVYALIQQMGLDAQQFGLYAVECYRMQDWSTTAAGLKRAISQLQQYRDDPAGLQRAIENALGA